jgi:hypothetical protein
MAGQARPGAELPQERALGISDQVLDHLGYCVTERVVTN